MYCFSSDVNDTYPSTELLINTKEGIKKIKLYGLSYKKRR